ncbi:MAG: GTP 3',8-cyclase MoaA [Gammaproteobacteria bacterium]|nr:GTP 3',8-cyclase MoaA [Gammaproteobacteria bacterium]
MLQDGHGRLTNYLRLSVTARCNLRCSYCLPDGAPPEPPNLLDVAALTRLAAIFADLGIRRIRLTGGEPLVRRDLPELVRGIAALPGIEDISMTTNGVLLERHAAALKAAGLKRINVSLDSLDPARFKKLAGADVLNRIRAGLESADAVGLGPIKINMVVMEGINDHDVEAMAAFCARRGYILRLIEPMPMGDIYSRPAEMAAILERLQVRFDLCETRVDGGGPARYWQSSDGRLRLGLITPLSQHFCASCNRVRLTATGTLHTCLDGIGGVELGEMLHAGADDEAVRQAILHALAHKPGHHHFNQAPTRGRRLMAITGG